MLQVRNPDKPQGATRAGFTLVEVAISIGIVGAFALPLFGLLVVGTDLNRESLQTMIAAQIVDQVGRELEQTAFSDLQENSPVLTFNSGGVRLDEPEMFDRLYQAKVTVLKEGTLPGSGDSPSGNLARVNIEVALDPLSDSGSNSSSPSSDLFADNPDIRRFSIFVSRND